MDKLNEIKIDVPEGMEYYIENNIIKFRPIKKELTYDDIVKELFKYKKTYYIDIFCNIRSIDKADISYKDINNCTSEKQLKKLLAINQLMNVAKYLNRDWQPDWNNDREYKYYLYVSDNEIQIDYMRCRCSNIVYFKSKELAQKTIDILEEETIKLALCNDW